jgi:hypothetical protein
VISSRVQASVALCGPLAKGRAPQATSRCNHTKRRTIGCRAAVPGLKLSASCVAKVSHPALIGPRSEGFEPNMMIFL